MFSPGFFQDSRYAELFVHERVLIINICIEIREIRACRSRHSRNQQNEVSDAQQNAGCGNGDKDCLNSRKRLVLLPFRNYFYTAEIQSCPLP